MATDTDTQSSQSAEPEVLAAVRARLALHENRILAGAVVMDKDRADLDYLTKFMQLRGYMQLEQLNVPALFERFFKGQDLEEPVRTATSVPPMPAAWVGTRLPSTEVELLRLQVDRLMLSGVRDSELDPVRELLSLGQRPLFTTGGSDTLLQVILNRLNGMCAAILSCGAHAESIEVIRDIMLCLAGLARRLAGEAPR